MDKKFETWTYCCVCCKTTKQNRLGPEWLDSLPVLCAVYVGVYAGVLVVLVGVAMVLQYFWA